MMNKRKKLLVGITDSGIMHTRLNEFDIDARFAMVKASGVFDYVDKSPFATDFAAYHAAIKKHDLPIRAGGFYYFLERDEPLLEWHLNVARDFGALVHNVQILTNDIHGKPVTDEQVADIYCRAAETGDRTGVVPCFEVHVNMWSEHFGRVERVAKIVKGRGFKFNITLDHSHVIFKIDNPREQEVQNMREDVESGKVVLDPFKPGDVCSQWIDANYVRHAHARAAAPGGPVNLWASHPDGRPGRGIQYPFIEPKPGEWHSAWREAALEPWKEVIRKLLKHHAENDHSELETISTEFISPPDYGGGAKYSIFEHSVACAKWIRNEWAAAQKAAAQNA